MRVIVGCIVAAARDLAAGRRPSSSATCSTTWATRASGGSPVEPLHARDRAASCTTRFTASPPGANLSQPLRPAVHRAHLSAGPAAAARRPTGCQGDHGRAQPGECMGLIVQGVRRHWGATRARVVFVALNPVYLVLRAGRLSQRLLHAAARARCVAAASGRAVSRRGRGPDAGRGRQVQRRAAAAVPAPGRGPPRQLGTWSLGAALRGGRPCWR